MHDDEHLFKTHFSKGAAVVLLLFFYLKWMFLRFYPQKSRKKLQIEPFSLHTHTPSSLYTQGTQERDVHEPKIYGSNVENKTENM